MKIKDLVDKTKINVPALVNGKITFAKRNPYKISSNIIPAERFERTVEKVLTTLSTIETTSGPFGRNKWLIDYQADTPLTPSKDGRDIVKNINFNDYLTLGIRELVREATDRVHYDIGDGTTTITKLIKVLTHKFIELRLKDRRFKYITPKGFEVIVKAIVEVLHQEKDHFMVYAPVNPENFPDVENRINIFSKVASISANNDTVIGNELGRVFGESAAKYPAPLVENGTNSKKDISTSVTGFEFDTIPITDTFMKKGYNEEDGTSIKFKNPLFLLIDGPLLDSAINNLHTWIEAAAGLNRPLLIIAETFGNTVKDYFNHMCLGKEYHYVNAAGETEILRGMYEFAACPVKSSSVDTLDVLTDFKVYLDATTINTRNGYVFTAPDSAWDEKAIMSVFGKAKHIKLTNGKLLIEGGEFKRETMDKHKAKLEEELTRIRNSEEFSKRLKEGSLMNRLSRLEGSIIKIYVSGDNEKEKQYKKSVVEDAARACASAAKHGVHLGGNLNFKQLYNKLGETLVQKIHDNIIESGQKIGSPQASNNATYYIRKILTTLVDNYHASYKDVFINAGYTKKEMKSVFDRLENSRTPITYNILTESFESIPTRGDLLVPGNTDLGILDAIAPVLIHFYSVDEVVTPSPIDANAYEILTKYGRG